MGYTFSTSLTVKNRDEFRRVLEFAQPDKSETYPQTDEEYKQAGEYADSLTESECRAWKTRHCARFYVDFYQRPEELELSWAGEAACEIAELVVAQFPDIEFRICDSWDLGAKYGLSENGKIRWLELDDDVNEI